MAVSNASSVQGSFDKESKLDEDINHDDFSDQEQDVEQDCRRLPQESVRMFKISEKRALKLKAMESNNASLQTTLEDSKFKVKQLEEQRLNFSNNLIAARKENELLKE